MRKRKAFFTIILLVIVMLVMTSTASFAAGIQEDISLKLCDKVTLGDKDWLVVGNGTNGIKGPDGHVTLLLGDIDGSSSFCMYYGSLTDVKVYKYYGNSTLHGTLSSYVRQANGFSSGEITLIPQRRLSTNDGIMGSTVSTSAWALSYEEYTDLMSEAGSSAFAANSQWWLRTPRHPDDDRNDFIYYANNKSNGGGVNAESCKSEKGVRPGLYLNLTQLLFASDAGGSGKETATTGGPLVAAEAIGSNDSIKFTVKSESQALTLEATEVQKTQRGTALSFVYRDASIGANQYISCLLSDQSNGIKYYGKLVDCASQGNGTLIIPLEGVADGTYTVKVFSEQANGNKHTDFASQPITMTLNVSGGQGQVSNFSGGDHIHSEEANCDHAVTCSICGQSYGPLEHNWGKWVSISSTQHSRTCQANSSHVETEAHQYDNDLDDTCNKCGYVRILGAGKIIGTGDHQPIWPWIVLLIAAGIAAFSMIKGKKQKEEAYGSKSKSGH